jgi:hypothetical protein
MPRGNRADNNNNKKQTRFALLIHKQADAISPLIDKHTVFLFPLSSSQRKKQNGHPTSSSSCCFREIAFESLQAIG